VRSAAAGCGVRGSNVPPSWPSSSSATCPRTARARSTFHRFAEALADLDAAGQCGADRDALDAERAAILPALGRHVEAGALSRRAAERRADVATLGALAVLEAERGQYTEAEHLFTRARSRYRGISPFPVASLEFRRGLMWLGRRDLAAARSWFDAAARRVPAHAPAQGRLAEVDAVLGATGAAVDRLRPLVASVTCSRHCPAGAIRTTATGVRLLDRGAETQALREVLDAVRRGTSGTLVLRGEPGVGKSALLGYAVGQAGDMQIVRTVAVESEMALAFAAVHQLLSPLLPGADRLPEPQRRALAYGFRGFHPGRDALASSASGPVEQLSAPSR